MGNRHPGLGPPVGKGVEGTTPILLAKLSLDQEIDVLCKAYKVSYFLMSEVYPARRPQRGERGVDE
jgi:hypothetical protein